VYYVSAEDARETAHSRRGLSEALEIAATSPMKAIISKKLFYNFLGPVFSVVRKYFGDKALFGPGMLPAPSRQLVTTPFCKNKNFGAAILCN
jgi:hypothetical protein